MENAVTALSLHASTSPSYVILQSLDNVNKLLHDNPCYFDKAICRLDKLKAELTDCGYTLVGDERLKLTIATKPYGYTGEEVASYLESKNIYVEFCDKDFVTMVFSPCNKKSDFNKVFKALASLPKRDEINIAPPTAHILEVGMDMSTALFAPYEIVAVNDAVGRILSSPTVSCPPAIPVAVCGEIIDDKAVEIMKYYSINTCIVVKNN